MRFPCKVKNTAPLEMVTWADGTDEQIVAMLEAHYNGNINIHDYWTVGDERIVHLSAMPATGVGETHVEQDVTYVLSNNGGKMLADGVTECAFQVDQKNVLANNGTREEGYINSNKSYDGGWNSCARRTWCNEVYYNAIPNSLKPIFKQHINITADRAGATYPTAKAISSVDYFALRAEKEVFQNSQYADATIEAPLVQVDYYKTSGNTIKKAGDNGNAVFWFNRSPTKGSAAGVCYVNSSGIRNFNTAYTNDKYSLAPFGVI